MEALMTTTSFGGELLSFKLDGIEKIHQGEDVRDDNGKVYWKRHAPVLFPIVGSLKNNTTYIDGKKYEMSQHGFARDMVFDIVNISEREHTYVLKYNENTLKMYPYKFELYISYFIEENKLTVIYKVRNLDIRPIYFGIGGHPAFIIDLKNNKYKVEFENEENNIKFSQLDAGLISYKNNYINNSLMSNNRCIEISKDTFSHDAIIMSGLSSRKLRLYENNIEKLEFEFGQFKYLSLWSKKNAPFLCIEPWQTTADYTDSNQDFTLKKDNIKLEVNEEYKCSYSIIFK